MGQILIISIGLLRGDGLMENICRDRKSVAKRCAVVTASMFLSLLIVCCLAVTDVHAALIYWEGDDIMNPSQWDNANNWNLGDIPYINDIGVLDSYVAGQPVVSSDSAIGELRVNSDSAGTLTLSVDNGALTVTIEGGLSGTISVYPGGKIEIENSGSMLVCQ